MTVLEEIRDVFASSASSPGDKARAIKSLPDDCPAFIIRISDGYGVAVPVDSEMEIAETFNSCRLRTGLLSIDGSSSNYLMLISAFEEYRYEFASLCAELVSPGDNGKNRKDLLEDPLEWWKHWTALVGNDVRDRTIYSVIAELLVLEHKLTTDKSAEWTATRMGSHDIECNEESCEVKSTCKRYGAEIIIAGQHQLTHKKPLYLYFLRMEESHEGLSVNDMKRRLIEVGYNPGKIELELQQQGLERGASIRNRKYKVLEKRKYAVDDSFPSITWESFKGNHPPLGITQIIYKIDLDALDYSAW